MVYGPVAQLGERTVQFYAPKFGDVAQASGRWFASMPQKKSIRACSSAGRAFGSHPRGREFESLQVHHTEKIRTSSPPGTGSDFFFISKILHTEFMTPGFACRRTGGFVRSTKDSSFATIEVPTKRRIAYENSVHSRWRLLYSRPDAAGRTPPHRQVGTACVFSGRYPVRLFSGKVWKMREYWMYFPFIILKSESKRSARLP